MTNEKDLNWRLSHREEDISGIRLAQEQLAAQQKNARLAAEHQTALEQQQKQAQLEIEKTQEELHKWQELGIPFDRLLQQTQIEQKFDALRMQLHGGPVGYGYHHITINSLLGRQIHRVFTSVLKTKRGKKLDFTETNVTDAGMGYMKGTYKHIWSEPCMLNNIITAVVYPRFEPVNDSVYLHVDLLYDYFQLRAKKTLFSPEDKYTWEHMTVDGLTSGASLLTPTSIENYQGIRAGIDDGILKFYDGIMKLDPIRTREKFLDYSFSEEYSIR